MKKFSDFSPTIFTRERRAAQSRIDGGGIVLGVVRGPVAHPLELLFVYPEGSLVNRTRVQARTLGRWTRTGNPRDLEDDVPFITQGSIIEGDAVVGAGLPEGQAGEAILVGKPVTTGQGGRNPFFVHSR